MGHKENVSTTLEAIESVKDQMKQALAAGDAPLCHKLRDDLIVLQACLIGPVTAFLEEFESKKNAA